MEISLVKEKATLAESPFSYNARQAFCLRCKTLARIARRMINL